MNYEEAMNFIQNTSKFGSVLGLDNIKELLERLGNPQDQLKVVHIAGTNGKGSVSAMTESVLRESGYITGLYTSPHLVDFSERIRVCGKKISDSEFLELAKDVKYHADKMLSESKKLTFFELTTAIAFAHFARCGVEIAVIEVGMGGRLDSTNVISPEVCAITPISMEHAEFLGDTLAKIAAEKAGIIKPGIPVVCSKQPDDVIKVIRSKTDMLIVAGENSKFEIISSDSNGTEIFSDAVGMNLSVPLIGSYQGDNCALAVIMLRELMNRGFYIPDEAFLRGLQNTKWPGRLETVSFNPRIIIDCTHTPAGAEVVASEVKRIFGNVILIFGILKDKDVKAVAEKFGAISEKAFIVTPDSKRALSAEQASKYFEPYTKVQICPSLKCAISAAKENAGSNGTILITGSLYMAGEAMEVLNVSESIL